MVRAVHHILIAESTGDGTFCTMVCAVLRPASNGVTVSVVCAGHPTPLVRRSDGSVSDVPSRGALLGALPETTIPSPTHVQLGPGDVLLFFTDGVTEARRD